MMAGFFVTVYKIVTALIYIAGLVLCWKYFRVHKFLTFVLFIVLLISSIGYGISLLNEIAEADKDRPPDISGYIMDKEEDKILVVSTEASKNGDSSEEYYDAAWIININKPVRVGQFVEVWFVGGVDDSYPAQAMARQLSIINSENMNEELAIQHALQSDQVDHSRIYAIHSVTWDEENSTWSIQFIDVMDSQNILTIDIEDEL